MIRTLFRVSLLLLGGGLFSFTAQAQKVDTVVYTMVRRPVFISIQPSILMGRDPNSLAIIGEPQLEIGAEYRYSPQWRFGAMVGVSIYQMGYTPIRLGTNATYLYQPNPNWDNFSTYFSLGVGTHRTYDHTWWNNGWMDGEKFRGYVHGSMGLQWDLPRMTFRMGLGYQVQETYQEIDNGPWWQSTNLVRFPRMSWNLGFLFPLQRIIKVEHSEL